MARKRKKQNKEKAKWKKRERITEKPIKFPILTLRLKRWIGSLLMLVFGVVVALSFFDSAGKAGDLISNGLIFLIGRTIFFIPVLFLLAGLAIFKPLKKRIFAPVFLGLLILIVGASGMFHLQADSVRNGGWLGYISTLLFLNYFGMAVSVVVFLALIIIGCLILWEFMPRKKAVLNKEIENKKKEEKAQEQKKDILPVKQPKFEIKTLEIFRKKKEDIKETVQDGLSSRFSKEPKEKGTDDGLIASGVEYKIPLIELFSRDEDKPITSGDIEQNASMVKKTLQDFGIAVEMAEISIGPTVTQYTLKPAEGVKLSKITSLNNDLALALAAHPIRIEAPIPGRSLVGIEVPNKIRAQVNMGNLMSSDAFSKSSSRLTLALGKNVMGAPIIGDLARMPHLLVAGATGSGKTVCLNSLILSLIYRNSPEILRLVLIDPKRVEFPIYADLPHLLTPVIFNSQKVVYALSWLIGEMERRFDMLKDAGVRDIGSFNKAKKKGNKLMPYIVVVIDELADLMAAKGREIEGGIVRLSQLSRAVGIHLIVATQRPSVEVITGLIKANITSRIAFQVASQVDSRTILDMAGAEKLLGRGDMLFTSTEFSRPRRVQGGFVSSSEIKKVVKFIKEENIFLPERDVMADFLDGICEGPGERHEIESSKETVGEEPMFNQAKAVVLEYQKASASLLQRRLRIGYARAARMLDMLEDKGIIGAQDGAKPREVYIKNPNDKIQMSNEEQNDDEWEGV